MGKKSKKKSKIAKKAGSAARNSNADAASVESFEVAPAPPPVKIPAPTNVQAAVAAAISTAATTENKENGAAGVPNKDKPSLELPTAAVAAAVSKKAVSDKVPDQSFVKAAEDALKEAEDLLKQQADKKGVDSVANKAAEEVKNAAPLPPATTKTDVKKVSKPVVAASKEDSVPTVQKPKSEPIEAYKKPEPVVKESKVEPVVAKPQVELSSATKGLVLDQPADDEAIVKQAECGCIIL